MRTYGKTDTNDRICIADQLVVRIVYVVYFKTCTYSFIFVKNTKFSSHSYIPESKARTKARELTFCDLIISIYT